MLHRQVRCVGVLLKRSGQATVTPCELTFLCTVKHVIDTTSQTVVAAYKYMHLTRLSVRGITD